MNYNNFSSSLIDWYDANKRDLPWRNTRDPYFIWLSEIILQQTRVNQGLPYYLKFITAYPTIEDLAKAEEVDVLRLWQGLGYYSRARNMLKSAKHIVDQLDGSFPSSYKELIKLKGIGKYTAGAIASFAFKEKVPVVDGNVLRVLSRVFGVHEDIASLKGQKFFIDLATEILPSERFDIFNQALMEFGATVCTPKSFKCEDCIFSQSCYARLKETVQLLPVKSKSIKKKLRHLTYFVINCQGKLLLHQRKGKDIWQGLYQFYAYEGQLPSPNEYFKQDELLKDIFKSEEINFKISQEYKHVLTHQIISAKFLEIEVKDISGLKTSNTAGLRFFSLEEIDQLPKPILIHNYLSEKYF